MTATHQLKTALTSVAFAGRAIFLVSTFAQTDKCDTADVSLALILNSLSNALLGIDANDPPKTLASMQLICSIYLSVSEDALVSTCTMMNVYPNGLFVLSVNYNWKQ